METHAKEHQATHLKEKQAQPKQRCLCEHNLFMDDPEAFNILYSNIDKINKNKKRFFFF